MAQLCDFSRHFLIHNNSRHFHVPAFILARILEAGVLSVTAVELAGFTLMLPITFEPELGALDALFPFIKA